MLAATNQFDLLVNDLVTAKEYYFEGKVYVAEILAFRSVPIVIEFAVFILLESEAIV